MKGKKRKRNTPTPTHSPGAPSPNGPTKTPSPSFLPYQLRSSTKNSSKYPSTNSSPIFRMDNIELLEAGHEDEILELPTVEEAEALLRDEGDPDPDSPTAAVKSAIEAQIAENLVMLDSKLISNIDSNIDSNKDTAVPIPAPAPAPQTLAKKPQPLFPEGLPPSWAPPPKASAGVTPFLNPSSKAKTTYAAKAKTPPKAREMVEHILFVYSSWTNKAPINPREWGLIDSHLIGMELKQDPADPLIRIANSGYDAAHRCGFIACRDQASADRCKSAIRGIGDPQSGKAFRAWAKGEQPEARLCRLFFPTRFDSLSELLLIDLLKKHNPPLQKGTLVLKNVEDVQGGRAVFLEFDIDSYSYIKLKGHKVEFALMDIDCQTYNPPKRVAPTGPGLSGIVKLTAVNSIPSTSAASSVSADSAASSSSIRPVSTVSTSASSKGAHPADPRQTKRAQPPLTFTKAPTPVSVADHGKRSRPEPALATDGAKKPHSNK